MGNPISDAELIANIIDGKQDAITLLINRYQDFAFNLSIKILRNREDAEEATQDSFVKAIKAIRAFQKQSSFKTWLYRIVYNTASNKLRQGRSRKTLPIQAITTELNLALTTDSSNYDNQVQQAAIKRAFDTLSPENRVIMALFYQEQMTIEEISEITLLSQNLIKVRMHRCRELLRPMLSMLVEFKSEDNDRRK